MMKPVPGARFQVPNVAIVVAATAVCLLAGVAFWRHPDIDFALTTVAGRGALTAQLTVTGVLRPAQSITYRSPLGGREAEIIELVPEGTRVGEGDLLVRLDTTELQREIERARQEVRQTQLEIQVAEIERGEAEAGLAGVSEGEGALGVDEVRTRLQLAEKRAERLRRGRRGRTERTGSGAGTAAGGGRDEALTSTRAAARLAAARAEAVGAGTHPGEGG